LVSYDNQLTGVLKENGYIPILVDDIPESKYTKLGAGEWYGWFDAITNLDDIFNRLDKFTDNSNPYFAYFFSWKLHAPYLSAKAEIEKKYPQKVIAGLPLDEDEFEKLFSEYLAGNFKKVFTSLAISENKSLFSNPRVNKIKIMELYDLYDSDDTKRYVYLLDSWQAKYEAYFRSVDGEDPTQRAYLREIYQETLNKIDTELKPLFDYLNSEKVSQNTIIILRSDHGEEFYEHGSFGHQNDLFNELLNTPLAIRVPGIKAGQVNSLTQDIDLMPTILDLLNLKIPDTVQGKSLTPLLKDQSKKINDWQIAQKGDSDYLATFRQGKWKLIMKEKSPYYLFDLENDPGEKNNLMTENTQTVKELFEKYNQIIESLPKPKLKDQQIPLFDDEKRKRLKDEGYF